MSMESWNEQTVTISTTDFTHLINTHAHTHTRTHTHPYLPRGEARIDTDTVVEDSRLHLLHLLSQHTQGRLPVLGAAAGCV